MKNKFLNILKIISKELIENRISMDEAIMKISSMEIDLLGLQNDIIDLEQLGTINDEEIDMLKAFISYVMIKDDVMEREDIYTIVFGRGRRITWH